MNIIKPNTLLLNAISKSLDCARAVGKGYGEIWLDEDNVDTVARYISNLGYKLKQDGFHYRIVPQVKAEKGLEL